MSSSNCVPGVMIFMTPLNNCPEGFVVLSRSLAEVETTSTVRKDDRIMEMKRNVEGKDNRIIELESRYHLHNTVLRYFRAGSLDNFWNCTTLCSIGTSRLASAIWMIPTHLLFRWYYLYSSIIVNLFVYVYMLSVSSVKLSLDLFFRLDDATLANSKFQQSLKIKEEKILELETQ